MALPGYSHYPHFFLFIIFADSESSMPGMPELWMTLIFAINYTNDSLSGFQGRERRIEDRRRTFGILLLKCQIFEQSAEDVRLRDKAQGST